MGTYWASDEGVARREEQSGDAWLDKCRANGFGAPRFKIDRATVVPPEPGAPRRFVGVSWFEGRGLWKAEYKYAKRTRDSENRRTLGYYATDELAARARHKHICDEGFEQFNTMDVLDDATGLMVPREKKRRREEPVAAAPTRQSTRVRKAISRD